MTSCAPGFYLAGTTTCLPVIEAACLPCTEDANCVVPGNACVQLDGGLFCGQDCSAGNLNGYPEGTCASGYSCTELGDGRKQCLPDSQSCSCSRTSDQGKSRPCTEANSYGTCAGLQACGGPDAGWSQCSAYVPSPEVCNGIDDNCNGRVDEGVTPPAEPCQVQNAFGTCSGAWQCAGNNGWVCDAKTPSAEVCDLIDNDCDGATDEDFRDGPAGPYDSDDDCGICGRGCDEAILFSSDTRCVVDGGVPLCVAISCIDGFYVPPDTNRVCIPTTGAVACSPCSDDAQCAELPGGKCTNLDGGRFCTRGCADASDCGNGFTCDAGRCIPQTLSCTCLPGMEGRLRPCVNQNGFGACTGTSECDPGQAPGWSACSARTPAAETCNGVDDNCNGQADEQVSHDPVSCSATNESGTCAAQYVCGGVSGWECPVRTPLPEACNFQDDNCDGQVDETFKNAAGLYVDDQNCGTCGVSCDGLLPNATSHCAVSGTKARCEVESCEEGFYQVGPLTCLPATDTTCVPCVTDANCPTPGDKCLALDGGKFCGRDCAADNAHGVPEGVCAPGYSCADVAGGARQCVPESGSCSCLESEDGDVRTCQKQNGFGKCFGTETCGASAGGGWEGCTALEPAAETCNGVDDDCNGQADEGVTHTPATCETTNTWGTCTADYACRGEAGWSCQAATPAEDVCDNKDNDCDGQIDEDFRDASGLYVDIENCGSCGISCVGAIPNAMTQCVVRNGTPRCEVAECAVGYYAANAMTCLPSQDSSCLACATDANCPTPGDKCLPMDGGNFCGRDCSATNVHGRSAGECDAGFTCQELGAGVAQCVPTSGSCSCLPGDEDKTRTCINQNPSGSCFGSETCDPATGWTGCTARVPAPETCNGQDDNCDGRVDEAVTHDPATCTNAIIGVGSCSATYTCAGAAGWRCDVGTPEAESCDFADNNCDGQVDEAFKNGAGKYVDDDNCGSCGISCDGAIPNAVAQCAVGSSGQPRCVVRECDFGYFQTGPLSCQPATSDLCLPCATDDDCPTPGDVCVPLGAGGYCGKDCGPDNLHGLPPGTCDVAGFACQDIGGAGLVFQCVPESGACDCLPANQGKQRTCSATNPSGTCFGTETCEPTQGWSLCTAKTPADESCNGKDDNCDGRIDEELTHAPASCESVVAGVGTCSATYTCQGTSGWQCPVATPLAEVCDFQDNNCDGRADEPFRNAQGLYTDVDNCGSCGISCTGKIPNATETCAVHNGSPRCEVASCDAGYYQVSPLTCLPATDSQCTPCATDANCQTPGDRCIPMDGGNFCGRDCSAGNKHGYAEGACPSGYQCAAFDGGQQCIPTTNSCSCLPGDEGRTRTCSNANAAGTCFGSSTCSEASGWSACTAKTPAAESCNGQDDNCNGAIDEGVTHEPATCAETVAGVGTCSATYVCGGASGWQCDVATPVAETCDFADNNCDGHIDEAFKNADGKYVDDQNCGSCGVSCDGAIPNASAMCQVNASGQPRCVVRECDAGYYPTGPLSCLPATNSLCTSCAGDGDCPTPGDVCVPLEGGGYCGKDCGPGNLHGLTPGTCDVAGFQCEDITAGGATPIYQCVPKSGACDCLPANDGKQRTCSTTNPSGTCFGKETCDADHGWGACTARTPAEESCNGQDDNCNGQIDEAVTHDPASCNNVVAGVGTCSAAYVCGGASGWQCPAATPVAEVCDFRDNDCDGAVDEAFRDAQGLYTDVDNCGSCGVSCAGKIPNATARCAVQGGSPRCEVASCEPGYYQVSPLTCLPAVDSTCTPCVSDANCSTPGDRCIPMDGGKFCGRDCGEGNNHGLAAGVCPTGYQCSAFGGGMQCQPVSGSCSCLPGDEGRTRTCSSTNASGTCFGTATCDPSVGWGSCTAKTPAAESCNGQDDNCNGQTDEAPTQPETACAASNGYGTCTAAWACGGVSGWQCPAAAPRAETCDFADNDCDGEVDEDFKQNGKYVDDDNCGSCGISCAGAVPHATAGCGYNGGNPRCEVVSCDSGYFQTGPLSCAASSSNVCRTCLNDDDCSTPGDRCLTVGTQQVCGQDCAEGNLHGVPAGTCEEAGFTCNDFGGGMRQCVPESGTCDCLPADNGKARACSSTNAQGTCYGSETCDATRGWVGCSAKTPAAETCNGLDDNCNGQADEGVAHTPATCNNTVAGVGTCSASYVCGGAAGWGCSPATPLLETCNGQDDNCDGAVDEAFKNGAGQYVHDQHCGACGISCQGAIANATATCSAASGAPRCEVLTCAAGYYKASALTCLPATDNSCLACASDAGCGTPGDKCVALDGQNVCARSCDAGNAYGTPENQCPTGFLCEAQTGGAKVCVPKTHSCSCLASDGGKTRTCRSVNESGTCFGTETCDASTGWYGCSAKTPAAETCNGLDDNCNGQADEGVAAPTDPCQTTNAHGTCSAAWSCQGAGGWVCPAATPAAETCDFADNDCDGQVDEDFKQGGKYVSEGNCGTCGSSCAGVLPHATATCRLNNGTPRCEVESCDVGYYVAGATSCLPATATACSPCAADSDCGNPGDRCLTLSAGKFCGQDCSAGNVHGTAAGVCQNAGFICQAFSGGKNQCVPQSGACDCLAGDSGKTRLCSSTNASGTCYGNETCDPASGWVGCNAKTPAAEICNGLDDNCNSQVDEGATPPAEPCAKTNGYGTCSASWTCQGTSGWQCPAATPAAETCNFKDDDCDGEVDEAFKNGSGYYVNDANCGTCGVSCAGAIPNASTRCVDNGGAPRCEVLTCAAGYYEAGPLTCLPAVNASCQSCATDANCPTPGDKCLSLDGGQFCGYDCSAGNAHGTAAGECPSGMTCQTVTGGFKQCIPQSASCTCLAGDAGKTRTCLRSNAIGTCYGSESCSPTTGWSACTALTPAAEVCDGVDNNCNSAIDDVSGRGQSCNITSSFGQCPGVQDCASGSSGLTCVGRTPAAEVCNYVDDDCDGTTDEGFGNLNQSCSTGQGACQRFGFYVCTDNGASTRCNAVAGTATAELCDGVDNDCNGQVDEKAAWANKGQPCTMGKGVCQETGVFQCSADGATTECSKGGGTPAVGNELGLCNNLDDDCDGQIDEDYPTKGQLCSVGVGACKAFGNMICNADGSGVSCSATAGTAGVETCDLLDNDCNGVTDNGFVNAQGKYYRDDFCGNCFTDCTTIFAKANGYGSCSATGTPTCGLQCCAPGSSNPRCAGVTNYFYNLNGVPDDGCEFKLDPAAIYVSNTQALAQDTAGCGLGPVGTGTGGANFPCRTLGYGITRAVAAGRTKVLVADGLYEETVSLVDGVSLLGGYRADTWERNVAATNTIIRGASSIVSHVKTIIAQNIKTKQTVLEGFIIDGQSSFAPGGNSYAIWVRDSNQLLEIRSNVIFGGSGGLGTNGTNGSLGGDGGSGQVGERSILTTTHNACTSAADVPGNVPTCWNSVTNTKDAASCGGGGANTCGGVSVSGGDGASAKCPNTLQSGTDYDAQPSGSGGSTAGTGNGTAGGGGEGGHDRISTNCGTFGTGGFSATGLPGANGGRGSDKAGGTGAGANNGQVVSYEWKGSAGGAGANGSHGGGGGGGGAGGGADVTKDCSSGSDQTDDSLGGSGGGGGAGGCGGTAGTGGQAGGGAFAIFITNTAATSAGSLPLIVGNTITRGSGGDGGAGGSGGKGGLGGNGGDGGLTFGRWTYAMGFGGRGGQGGDGGHGGGGGGGQGGASFGVYLHNFTGTPSYQSFNTFLSGGFGGRGGFGGTSVGQAGQAGADGAAANKNW